MNPPPRFIGIAGGSGSGKSHLAREIQTALGSRAASISLDHFYRDLSPLPPDARAATNFDDPTAIDWQCLIDTLDALAHGHTGTIPGYDFTTHTRPHESTFVNPHPVLILEGLWTLHLAEVRQRLSLSIFIDCPASLRLSRRTERDIALRGRTADSVRRQFEQQVAPMHDRFVQPQAARADVILKSPFPPSTLARILSHPALQPAA